MKLPSVVLPLLIVVSVQTAHAIEPDEYVVAMGDGQVIYFDPMTVKVRDGMLTAWITSDQRVPAGPSKIASMKELFAVDCESEKFASMSFVAFNQPGAKGEILGRVDKATAMAHAVPKSLNAYVLEAICTVSRGESITDLDSSFSYSDIQAIRSGSGIDYWWYSDEFHPGD